MVWNDSDGSGWSRADYLRSIEEIEAIDDKRHPISRDLQDQRSRLALAQEDYLKAQRNKKRKQPKRNSKSSKKSKEDFKEVFDDLTAMLREHRK